MPDTQAIDVQPLILELAALERPDWDARLAAIPEWHPRNEVPAGAAPPAEATGEGEGEGGQGDEEPTSGGLYDLASAPDELRPYLEAELKKIEGNVTRKMQEAADFRKKYEAFEPLGVADVPAEELAELLELRRIASDPDQFAEWWRSVGEHLGLTAGDADAGEGDDELEDGEGPDLEALLERMLEERIGPIKQRFEEQDSEQRVQQELQTITGELDALQEQHGEFDRDAVCQLALAYADDDDAITKGFADYQRITGGAQRDLVADKSGQPGVPLSGGQPATAPEKVDSFEAAAKAARERLRAG